MSVWPRRILVLLLFGALVAVLLKFQGIVLRDEHPPVDVPAAPRVGADEATARVERRTLGSVETHPGFVEAIDPATLAPRVMASVIEVAGREGDAVARGDVLVVLDDRDARAKLAQAEAALEAARAGARQAELALDRARRLHESEALTTQALEAAEAAHDGARAQVQRASEGVEEARTALAWFRLEAPFDGKVLERGADPGDLAAPGRPVLRLYREDRLRFRVAVPEERAADLSTGSTHRVVFDRLPPRDATLTRVLPPADPRTGTVTLHLAPASIEDLRPGMLGRLQLAGGERAALVVPADAVERIGQVERVRLVRDGRAVPVAVRTGKRHDGLIEVLSGLAEGEEVVVR